MITMKFEADDIQPLAELSLKEYYFPPKDDIVHNFFIPVLKRSERYDRATGYFTSSALVELSVGICDLAARGGKIRVITSPRLFADDINAIKQGYDLIQTMGKSMVRNFEKPDENAEINRLSLLSELISTGILEMKIAVMRNIDNYPNAMFHPKFGLMHDSAGGTVAFTGSMNESKNGLGGNWDHIQVSPADPSYAKSITVLQEQFDTLWDGLDESVMTLNMPDVVCDLIHSYHANESMLNLDEELLTKYDKDVESVYFKSPDWLKKNKRPYQEEAIANWIESGYSGVFNMATGTGKTKTALRALERLYNARPNEGIFTIIIAPQKHLVNQWADEIKKFGVSPIIGHSDSPSKTWKDQFRRKMIMYIAAPMNACLVTTISSFSSKDMQEWISKINNLAIVVDEAHNMGSDNRLAKLPPNAKYRLALSATMRRYNDSAGTQRLMDYFGKECIVFSLDEAIGKYLTDYNYYPISCHYSESEYNQMVDKNETLDSILRSSASEKEKRIAKEEYIAYSYTLNAKMESKFDALKSLMENYVGSNHFLIYSGKVQTDDEGSFEGNSHVEFMHAIDKCARILGMNGLGMKISRITYKESADDRKRIIEEFNRGDTEGIVAISCLDEGIDIPSVHTAVIMSSSDNPREYIQRRGRVLRLYPGKDHADIYDFVVIPKPLDQVDSHDSHSGLEQKVLAKEIRRMEEFSRVALNSEITEKMFSEISEAYGTTIEDILDKYGGIDYGQY